MIYVIIPEQLFNSPIPDFIKVDMRYPENYLVKDCIFGTPQQLEDGRWLCDARFRSYYNYSANGTDIIGISNNCTNRELYPQEVEQWKQMLGEENVIDDISNLIFKENVQI